MSSSRVFVSYVCLGDEAGARVGKQLLNDIRAAGTEAVADHETITDERFMSFLSRELPQCGRLIVVQTPQALQSWRVQSTLSLASTLVAQKQLQAIRVIAAPSEDINESSLWTALTSFDASVDYLRVRERIFLVLGLTQLDASDSFVVPLSFLPPAPSPQVPGTQPGVGGNIVPKTQPSIPVPQPVGSDWRTPAPAPMPQPVRSDWRTPAPAPVSPPVGSDWRTPAPAPMPPTVRANVPVPPPPPAPFPPTQQAYWPQQPVPPIPQPVGSDWRTPAPGPLPQPGRTNWPYPSPEPQPGFVTAQALARNPQQNDQSGSVFKRIWLRIRTFVAGLSKTSKLQP